MAHTDEQSDQKRRDEALKRALRTSPKPHKPKRDEGGQENPDRPRDKKD